MRNISYLIIVSLMLSLFSCREELKIDIKENEKKIVFNGLISPDSLIKINLSKSIGVLESSANLQFVNNAVVKLYEEDNYVEDLKYDKVGNYYSTINPIIDKEYKITVDAQNLKSVETSTMVYNPVEIFDIEYTIDSVSYGNDGYEEYYGYETSVDISFNDLEDKSNYYILQFYRFYNYEYYNQEEDTMEYRLE
ncbi:MAG: hypothetical protein PF487_05500, partial [Bacteroidales bacterium]|nr:hypothetical protein [Bacteroidales bacterium]